MAYSVYLDKLLLPVTPSEIETKINNKNITMELINLGEVNILKDAGLSDISFDAMIPQVKYPFSNYTNGFQGAQYYLDAIEKFKTDKKPFQFIVSRTSPGGNVLFHTNLKVSLEDYSIKEDANEGLDLMLSIKLKQFKDFATKKVVIKKPDTAASKPAGSIENKRPDSNNKPSGKTYTVKAHDSLWSICKSQLGNGNKSTYDKVYQLNKEMMDKRNKGHNVPKYTIYAGQVLKLE